MDRKGTGWMFFVPKCFSAGKATVVLCFLLLGSISCRFPLKFKSEKKEKEKSKSKTAEEEIQELRELRKEAGVDGESALRGAKGEVKQQQEVNRKKALALYGQAQKLFEKGRTKEAWERVKTSLKHDPNLEKARQLRSRLSEIQGFDRKWSNRNKSLQNRIKAQREQIETEIGAKKKRAKKLMEENKYEEAQQLLEQVQVTIRAASWIPSKKVDRLKNEIQTLKQEAKNKAQVREKEIEEKLRQQAKQKAAEDEKERMQEQLRWTDRMMEKAIRFLEQKKYDRAMNISETIMRRHPQFEPAKELKEDARKAKLKQGEKEHLDRKIAQWKKFEEGVDEAMIPYQETVQYPSKDYWEQVVKRKQQLDVVEGPEQEIQDMLSFKDRLEKKRVTMDFARADLSQILNEINNRVNMDYAIGAGVDRSLNQKVDFSVRDEPVSDVLSRLDKKFNVEHEMRDDHVVIRAPKGDTANTVVRIHGIQDIVRPIVNFTTPEMGIGEASSSGGNEKDQPVFTEAGAEGETIASSQEAKKTKAQEAKKTKATTSTGKDQKETKQYQMTTDQLVRTIKQNVAPTSWNRTSNVGIKKMGNGKLIISQTPEVQAEVSEFLEDVRSFTGSMVVVEVRFLELGDEFLEEFGIQFKELPDQTETDGIDGFPHDMVDGEQAGFAYSDPFKVDPGEDTDPGGEGLRFDGFDTRFRSVFNTATSLMDTGLGTARQLNTGGGLGLAFEVLEKVRYNMVVKALNKSARASIVDSARLTVFNTQRANVSLTTERTYIQDVDVQVAAGAQAFDPVVDRVRSGIVLDVRPIIGFNRKYVTLDLKSSVATVPQVRDFGFLEFDLDGVADDRSDVEIELPIVELKKAQTTLRVPDQGAVMIGGLKKGTKLNVEEGIPLLSDVPVLGSLFRQEVESDAKEDLNILVNVKIVDLDEIRKEEFGSGFAGGSGNTFQE